MDLGRWGWKQRVLSSSPWVQDRNWLSQSSLILLCIPAIYILNVAIWICWLVLQDAGWLFAPSWHSLWRERIYSYGFSTGSWRPSSRFSLSSQGLSVTVLFCVLFLPIFLMLITMNGFSICKALLCHQGVCRAGSMLGLQDSRTGLIVEVFRIMDHLPLPIMCE